MLIVMLSGRNMLQELQRRNVSPSVSRMLRGALSELFYDWQTKSFVIILVAVHNFTLVSGKQPCKWFSDE